MIYNKEAWERDQHSRQSASQAGIYRASPMVLGGKASPELTCYLLFLKRSQGSRFFLVCPHVYKRPLSNLSHRDAENDLLLALFYYFQISRLELDAPLPDFLPPLTSTLCWKVLAHEEWMT